MIYHTVHDTSLEPSFACVSLFNKLVDLTARNNCLKGILSKAYMAKMM